MKLDGIYSKDIGYINDKPQSNETVVVNWEFFRAHVHLMPPQRGFPLELCNGA